MQIYFLRRENSRDWLQLGICKAKQYWSNIIKHPTEHVILLEKKLNFGYTKNDQLRAVTQAHLLFPQASVMTDLIYDGCGSKKTCFGFPGGCIDTKSCTAVVSCLVQGDRYEFEMKARNSAYVAVGLSLDRNMVRIFSSSYVSFCVHKI